MPKGPFSKGYILTEGVEGYILTEGVEGSRSIPSLPRDTTVNDILPVADIGTVIARLADQQADLSRHIDRRWAELDVVHLARLLSVHGQNAARLGRLLGDWHAVHGPPPAALQQAMDCALHQAGEQLGVDLIDPALLDRDGPGQAPVDLRNKVETPRVLRGDDLARHLDRCTGAASPGSTQDGEDRPARLFAVYSRNAACLGRLLRLQHTLAPQISAELADLVARMIDEPQALVQEVCDASERSGRSAA